MIYQAVHKPVLLKEVLHYLIIDKNGIYVDCTVGEGGHSEAILASLSTEGKLIGIDKDEEQLKVARERLKKYGDRALLLKEDFRNLSDLFNLYSIQLVDGILMDLGISSYQLSNPARGFSFQEDGPLDMRFDRDSKITAAELVNTLSQPELAKIIREYGEERWAKWIAKAMVSRRKKKKIETTKELSQLIMDIIPEDRRSRIHPATRTFQALRIAVNREIEGLQEVIKNLAQRLKKGGRIVVICFHSLEDREIKNAFRFLAKPCSCPPEIPQCICGSKSLFKVITKRPLTPSVKEIEANIRSRSARMRVAEREILPNSGI